MEQEELSMDETKNFRDASSAEDLGLEVAPAADLTAERKRELRFLALEAGIGDSLSL